MAEMTREAGNARQRARILVVEDEPGIRNYCRLLLQSTYDVTVAQHGAEAVQLLHDASFDLVLTDLQMPRMNGLELLNHLRTHYPDTGAVILTAHATIETAKEAIRLGALDYLAKPVDADNLERTVRNCLELRRVRLEKERLSDLVVMYQFSQLIATSLDIKTQIDQISDFLWMRFAPATLSLSMIFPEEQEIVLLVNRLHEERTGDLHHMAMPQNCDENEIIRSHLRMTGSGQLQPSLTVGAVMRTHDYPIGYLLLTRREDQPVFDADERRLLGIFASQIAASLDNARLYRQLKAQHHQIIEALAEAIDARDAYTFGHSKQVTRYAVRLAEVLGLPTERLELLEYAGLLHDIGKIGIRDHILLKPGALTEEEYHVMQTHTRIGGQIISKVSGLRQAVPIVEGHHERIDGKGYPYGLKGDQLSTEARILAIADAFEAMTADRAYRSAMGTEEALKVLISGRGTKWDAAMVDVFVSIIRSEGERLRIGPRLKQAALPLKPVAVTG